MSDKVVVITGGGRGMGFEATKKLVSLGCKVFLGVRNPTQVEEKFKQILDDAQMEKIVCLKLDLMSTSSVRSFASELLNQTSTIHVLLNNGNSIVKELAKKSEGFYKQVEKLRYIELGKGHVGKSLSFEKKTSVKPLKFLKTAPTKA